MQISGQWQLDPALLLMGHEGHSNVLLALILYCNVACSLGRRPQRSMDWNSRR